MDMSKMHWPTIIVLVIFVLAVLGLYHLIHKH
jgi:hypothetical protein